MRHLRNVVAINEPEAENASDKLLWSRDEADVDAGGEEPPLERTFVPLGDCKRNYNIFNTR